MSKFKTREEWLVAANKLIDEKVFKQHGLALPKNVKLSCSFPSKHALSQKKRRIGECWGIGEGNKVRRDIEIFITPLEDDVLRVLGVLVHEDVHAIDNCENGHKGPFIKMARKVGLEGKPTECMPGEELNKVLKGIIKQLGAYPHKKLQPGFLQKTQTTRLIKCVCPDTGYVVRTTQKWIGEYGAPFGPTGMQMEVC